MTRKEFLPLMVFTAKILKKWAPDFNDTAVTSGYYNGLKEIPYEVLRDACKKLVDTTDEFPSIHQLRKLCGVAPKSLSEQANEAATQLYMSIMNPDDKFQLSDLALKLQASVGDYYYLKSLSSSDLNRLLPQWKNIAAQLADGIEVDVAPERLEGTALPSSEGDLQPAIGLENKVRGEALEKLRGFIKDKKEY